MLVSLKWLDTMIKVPDGLQDFCDRLDLASTGVEGVEVDLIIVVDEDVTAERIEQIVTSAGKKDPFESVRLFDVYRNDERVGGGKKSMTFRITYRAGDRALTSEEVEKTV